jgi:hypothetical protein
VRFKHIAITTRHYDASWWGAAEPIHVSAVPRRPGVQVSGLNAFFLVVVLGKDLLEPAAVGALGAVVGLAGAMAVGVKCAAVGLETKAGEPAGWQVAGCH